MERGSVPARWLLAAAVALPAAMASAGEPPPAPAAISDPSTSAAAAIPATSVLPPPAAPPLDDVPPPPYRPPSPRSSDYRWSLSFEYGPASTGAPNGLLGVGLGLGTIQGIRIETNVLLGFSPSSESVPPEPAWNASGNSYTGAAWSSRSVLLELSASRRQGPVEAWVGSGVHVSWAQWEATYSYLQCTDLLCLGPKIPSSDSDVTAGSGAVGLLVGAGARLAILDHVLLGISARWLAPATSHVGAQFQHDVRMGGLAIGVGLTLRLGGAMPRAGGPPEIGRP